MATDIDIFKHSWLYEGDSFDRQMDMLIRAIILYLPGSVVMEICRKGTPFQVLSFFPARFRMKCSFFFFVRCVQSIHRVGEPQNGFQINFVEPFGVYLEDFKNGRKIMGLLSFWRKNILLFETKYSPCDPRKHGDFFL